VHGFPAIAYASDPDVVDVPAIVERAPAVEPERPPGPVRYVPTMMADIGDGQGFHRKMEGEWALTACDKKIPAGMWQQQVDFSKGYAFSKDCGCWTQKELIKAQASRNVEEERRRTGEQLPIQQYSREDGTARPPTLHEISLEQKRETGRHKLAELQLEKQNKDKP